LAINGVVACRNALDSDVAVGDYAEENVVIPHRQYAYVVELHLLCSQLNSVIGPNATGFGVIASRTFVGKSDRRGVELNYPPSPKVAWEVERL